MRLFSQLTFSISVLMISIMVFGCDAQQTTSNEQSTQEETRILPTKVTPPTLHDTDDPAIWVNKQDPSKSLIIGTDKNIDGALYVYDLEGKVIEEKVVRNLQRPNNVDIEYGLVLGDTVIDIAVTTERFKNRIRVFSLPDMKPIDGGGLEVFVGEEQNAPMGISLYKKSGENGIYAFVGRKEGPSSGYLWQYLLKDDGQGNLVHEHVRSVGAFSQKKEIEAIVVDDSTGYIYYSDEGVGIRQYYADPDSPATEIALFGTEGFTQDHEGISIYPTGKETGYILVSDQQANQFHVFDRASKEHPLITILPVSTQESDGSEAIAIPLNEEFPKGLFVAMSDDKTFQYYKWELFEARIMAAQQK